MSATLERLRGLMRRPGAWLDGRDGVYPLRLGPDRRARVVMTLNEANFRALVADPGLRLRPGGGWVARTTGGDLEPSASCRRGPGQIPGERPVIQPDGDVAMHPANLGESPIAWLARRKDVAGRPWLTPAEAAAGERLRLEGERAASGVSVTMRWDALPRSGAGSAARVEPGDRALAASARVEAALLAVGPRLRPIVVEVCLRSTSLQLAERSLGLRRRQGKTWLKHGLQALARHYGIG